MLIWRHQTSRSSWQYFRDEPGIDVNGNIVDFPANNNSVSFKFKQQITGKTGNGDTKDVQIMAFLISKC